MNDTISAIWQEELSMWNIIIDDFMRIPDPILREFGMCAVSALAHQLSGDAKRLQEAEDGFDVLCRSTSHTPRQAVRLASIAYVSLQIPVEEADSLTILRSLMGIASVRGTVLAMLGKTNDQGVFMALGRKELAIAGANASHAENRAMKADVFAWLDSNMAGFKSMDKAAEAIAGKVQPIAFRTARAWVGEWKKKRSTGTA